MSRILVTGGASGLGAALVEKFVAAGHQVLRTDIGTTYAGDGPYLRLDVRSPEDWAAAVAWCEEQWGGLDILVNNAGIATGGRIDVETLDEWDRVVDINLMGVVRGCRAFTPLFKRQRSGQIVNTASVAGLVHPPMMSSYNTVKAGVVALSETLSHELKPFGIAVSVICPSFFRTNLADSFQGADRAMRMSARQLIEKSPRSADDIATVVLAGIAKRRFLIVPDRPARMAYLTKRWARPLYDRQMNKIAAKATARAVRADRDATSVAETPGGGTTHG
ncbi:SDR family NAD(P)-dependent oxidoreductase [Kribbella sandramycini]|uniref:NAD(P)-dependent dehydrogenase (Short-subunit alcohol dehydrogenase family) n=1 Tax=Kribbella sandramycini TaxID=60450 RepID=A0A7Y4L1L9_9ACTN|nr:NAD(P)-dependent dehydrogenase (short-subunit alcohol dehydrogenase family) [Kribbella sandramycini]NOL41786.1 SDR family NAD(P)-dependent oxidoreductase [Kribbella sandramycini]